MVIVTRNNGSDSNHNSNKNNKGDSCAKEIYIRWTRHVSKLQDHEIFRVLLKYYQAFCSRYIDIRLLSISWNSN